MKQAMQLLTSRETVEWYTPPFLIERAREFMGSIDLDPASCAKAQEWIKAPDWFDGQERGSGLELDWCGRVWLNPPFSNTSKWCEKARKEWRESRIDEALVLVNSNLGYKWYEEMAALFPSCQLYERLEFIRGDDLKPHGKAKRGQTLFWVQGQSTQAHNWSWFENYWRDLGRIYLP